MSHLSLLEASFERDEKEIPLRRAEISIGRDPDRDIVLPDKSVSRRHAFLKPAEKGFRIVDNNSSNGVLVNDVLVDDHLLKDGDVITLGEVVLAYAEPPPPPPPRPRLPEGLPEAIDRTIMLPQAAIAVESPADCLLKVVGGDNDKLTGQEFSCAGDRATIGRSPENDIQLEDPSISRRHALLRKTSDGYLLTDEGSANGLWIDSRRVQKLQLENGQVFKLGAVELRFDLVEEATAGEEAEPATPEVDMAAVARVFAEEGESLQISGNDPFLLDEEEQVWYLESGKIEVFAVEVKEHRPVGPRSHFITVEPGSLMFGMDFERYGMGSGFVAVGKIGTQLRKLEVSRLREMVADPTLTPGIAALVDQWIHTLSHSLTRDILSVRELDNQLEVGQEISLASGHKAAPKSGMAWLKIRSGNLLFIGMEALVFEEIAPTTLYGHHTMMLTVSQLRESASGEFFPLTRDTWVESSNDQNVGTQIEVSDTVSVIANPAVWTGLKTFHQVLCQCEFINKKLENVDEFQRLRDKAALSDAARDAAYRDIAGVVATGDREPVDLLHADDLEPIMKAFGLVANYLGLVAKDHPESKKATEFESYVAVLSKASRFRVRQVALRGKWWKMDAGPILAQVEEDRRPVAILPKTPTSYEMVDPSNGTRETVTEEIAQSLDPFAWTFYRPFPDGPVTVAKLLNFARHRLEGDFKTLIAMGILVGMIGALTPMFTGKIFDSAIPEAERGQLYQFVIALFLLAFNTTAFKITQGIATVRMQGKMEGVISAAVWDRLLNLPANFFRKYSSGDLAERAGGVSEIRDLLAGAAISSILGAFSSVFFIALMFKYNFKLALVAMAITGILIAFTTGANILQLRYQRQDLALIGKITGLVLQLISGVGKIRVAGAENHAFREWAKNFAAQRRINFTIGRIQNAVEVLNASYPVISSAVIFMMLVKLQSSGKGGASLSTGQFIAFTAAFGSFTMAMGALSDASLDMIRIIPVFERLKPIITTTPEIDETKAHPGVLKGEITLSHVSFRYIADGPWITKDLTLTIKAGEFVAFVGGSGCGKSTVMRLMLGFETPEMGAVYYDGQDLQTLDLREVRQQIGVVLQTSKLLPADVFRNIVGSSSLGIDDAWEAARMAGMADDIEQMPMGMHTYVPEGGGGFSGGQKQRLLICRAVVHKPRILYFDEATSALDNRSQAMVTESVNRMNSTRIVIAHRLSTVIGADRICVLDQGKVAEAGTYEELIKLDGLFAELARRQVA